MNQYVMLLKEQDPAGSAPLGSSKGSLKSRGEESYQLLLPRERRPTEGEG